MENIVFISDLHFDYTNDRFKPQDAEKRQTAFISYVKEQYSDCIICLAGDYYSDYLKTLFFVKEMERNKITGFFVLGNHDYWNDKSRTHESILKRFKKETANHTHFRFLMRNIKYYIGDLCIIGDTGWTSFVGIKNNRYNDSSFNLRHSRYSFEGGLSKFPDYKKVKNCTKDVIWDLHYKWINFANKIIESEPRVLILTHFPMVDFSESPKDLWFSSATGLAKANNYWNIFGHTHYPPKRKQANHISSQMSRRNAPNEWLEVDNASRRFGVLREISTNKSIIDISNALSYFYTPLALNDITTDLAKLSEIETRGFKRSSANKSHLMVLSQTPDEYIAKIQHHLSEYTPDEYIGYYCEPVERDILNAIKAAIVVVQNPDFSDFEKIREFITATVITGYIYNDMPNLLTRMRPIDDYDIVRFLLMFWTIKEFGIGEQIKSVRKHHNDCYISLGNAKIFIPEVNGHVLPLDLVKSRFKHMPNFPQISLAKQ